MKLILPEISRFYGIVIRMFPGDHIPPHFHAQYGGKITMINLEDCSIIKGSLPLNAKLMIDEWVKLHKDELIKDWVLCSKKLHPNKIEPLK